MNKHRQFPSSQCYSISELIPTTEWGRRLIQKLFVIAAPLIKFYFLQKPDKRLICGQYEVFSEHRGLIVRGWGHLCTRSELTGSPGWQGRQQPLSSHNTSARLLQTLNASNIFNNILLAELFEFNGEAKLNFWEKKTDLWSNISVILIATEFM